MVYRKLPEVTGTSAKGAWKKQDVVFELPSEFSRKICVTFFGDRADDAAGLQEGDAVQVSVNVESREFNGKWYTDVKAWKIVRKTGSDAATGTSHGGGRGQGYGAGYGDNYGGRGADGTAGSGGFKSGRTGGPGYAAGQSANAPTAGAPFNENFAPADDTDDLPF